MMAEQDGTDAASDHAQAFHQLYATLRIRDQLAFYRSRRDEYERADRQAIIVRNTLLALAAAAGAASVYFEGGARAGWAVVGAALGALATAIGAYAALIGFPQLEKLYSDAVRNLEEADLDWRELSVSADPTSEVERVEQIFRSEIGQWGQLVVKEAPIVHRPPDAAGAPGGPAATPSPPAAPPTADGPPRPPDH